MNTKNIGNLGESKVLCKFIEYGIPVYIPYGDNEKADLIAEFNGKLNKIQIKTSIKTDNGAMLFDLTSSTNHRKNGARHIYTSDEIDYFACYNVERDKIFLIDIKSLKNKVSIKIRFDVPKKNMNKIINYEDVYLIDNVLNSMNIYKIY